MVLILLFIALSSLTFLVWFLSTVDSTKKCGHYRVVDCSCPIGQREKDGG